jgi:hypothetical protein
MILQIGINGSDIILFLFSFLGAGSQIIEKPPARWRGGYLSKWAIDLKGSLFSTSITGERLEAY